jgi:hypothetical protein
MTQIDEKGFWKTSLDSKTGSELFLTKKLYISLVISIGRTYYFNSKTKETTWSKVK